MLGFGYIKAPPTTYLLQYRNGQLVREGAGIAFWYFRYNSVLAKLNVASKDVPFVFNEITNDVQDTTIQGDLTYRISDPKKTASLLNFSLDARERYTSDDPDKLDERLVKLAQISARVFTQRYALSELLVKSDEMVLEMLQRLRESEAVQSLGVEVMGLSILSIKASPEMTKALQAKSREQLLLEADEAIHHRRNTAVELERQIKENELQTEIAIEAKRRQVRETQIQADIAIEQQRSELVDQRVSNERKEAEARGDALRATLGPLKDVDWRTLMAVSPGGGDPKALIAMAFRDLADNAGKIGQLNISPDLLSNLLDSTPHSGSTLTQSDEPKGTRRRGDK
jgi:regulator of protease activity HflC (stomatin/prohibitin superfamily)